MNTQRGRESRRVSHAHAPLILLLATCLLPVAVHAQAQAPIGPWRFVTRAGDVETFRRRVEGSDVPAVRARVGIHASPACVFQVISDYDHFNEFVPYVKYSRIVRFEAHTRWVYQRLSLPGPVSDRHYVIRINDDLSRSERDVYRVTWAMSADAAGSLQDADAIVPAAMSGSWTLLPRDGSTSTQATYTVHLDPGGGALPAWLVTIGASRNLPHVVNAVRERVYRTACGVQTPSAVASPASAPHSERAWQ